MHRPIQITAFLLLIGVTGYLGWRIALEDLFKNKPSKEALTQMHKTLEVGDSQQSVLELYNQLRTSRTEIRKEMHNNVWEVGMPFELGSGDWILYLEFDESNRLSAAVIRTSDGIFRRPLNSPQDKGEFALEFAGENRG